MAISMDQRVERATAMQYLPDSNRKASIAASPNVLGFERFADRHKQVDLARARRLQVEQR